jgi:hypothetical protein
MTTLTEMRKLSNTKATIRVIRNKEHLLRPFCTNPFKIDEYARLPKTPKPLFIRLAEHLGKLQIDMWKIEIIPQYNRPPWTIDHQKHNFEQCAIVRGSNNQHIRVETNRIYKKNTNAIQRFTQRV